MRFSKLLILLQLFIFVNFSYSAEKKSNSQNQTKSHTEDHDHDHDESEHGNEKSSSDEKKSAHSNENADHDNHDHAGSEEAHEGQHHGEHEEENSQVGPDKGITAYNEEDGFMLSDEAKKNFEIRTVSVDAAGTVLLEEKNIVKSGIERNVFRLRNGNFKRIDFVLVGRGEGKMRIKSKDLKMGDEVVIEGLGFLRTSEIAATGGAPEGHSH